MDVHLYYENGKHYHISHINKYELTVERSAVANMSDGKKVVETSCIHCMIKGEFKKVLKRKPHSNYNTCILDLPAEQARALAVNILNVLDDKSILTQKALIDEAGCHKTIEPETENSTQDKNTALKGISSSGRIKGSVMVSCLNTVSGSQNRVSGHAFSS